MCQFITFVIQMIVAIMVTQWKVLKSEAKTSGSPPGGWLQYSKTKSDLRAQQVRVSYFKLAAGAVNCNECSKQFGE